MPVWQQNISKHAICCDDDEDGAGWEWEGKEGNGTERKEENQMHHSATNCIKIIQNNILEDKVSGMLRFLNIFFTFCQALKERLK